MVYNRQKKYTMREKERTPKMRQSGKQEKKEGEEGFEFMFIYQTLSLILNDDITSTDHCSFLSDRDRHLSTTKNKFAC